MSQDKEWDKLKEYEKRNTLRWTTEQTQLKQINETMEDIRSSSSIFIVFESDQSIYLTCAKEQNSWSILIGWSWSTLVDWLCYLCHFWLLLERYKMSWMKNSILVNDRLCEFNRLFPPHTHSLTHSLTIYCTCSSPLTYASNFLTWTNWAESPRALL